MAAEAAQVTHAETAPFGRLQIAAAVPRVRAGSWLIWALLVMVTLSGVSGLSYQVLWVRSLSLTFGVTTVAVTAVLAGFMAGLALGSALGGRLADRVRQPLVLYGLIEIGIGVFGLLSPRAFAALPELYRWLPQSASGVEQADGFGT
ncbi:MAG TPA: hypothetical protein VFN74_10255, partial [Chloroflexota bacterium]|nr:hypothetical protein [Chloroflexota bacterium]